MGMSIDGMMIVGLYWDEVEGNITVPEKFQEQYEDDLLEWLYEEHGMYFCSDHYDSGYEGHIGFPIDDVSTDDLNEQWLEDIRQLANEFKEITGLTPRLIGCQNVQ